MLTNFVLFGLFLADVRLSGLQYALLPTTKVSISDLTSSLSLRIKTVPSSDLPLLSSIELCFVEAPDVDARITPLTDGRYVCRLRFAVLFHFLCRQPYKLFLCHD